MKVDFKGGWLEGRGKIMSNGRDRNDELLAIFNSG
jgi:hypothetical protein